MMYLRVKTKLRKVEPETFECVKGAGASDRDGLHCPKVRPIVSGSRLLLRLA